MLMGRRTRDFSQIRMAERMGHQAQTPCLSVRDERRRKEPLRVLKVEIGSLSGDEMTMVENPTEEQPIETGCRKDEMIVMQTRMLPTEMSDLDTQTTEEADAAPEGAHIPALTQDQDHHPRAGIDTETTGAGGKGVLLHMMIAIPLTSGGG